MFADLTPKQPVLPRHKPICHGIEVGVFEMGLGIQLVLWFTCISLFPGRAILSLTLHLVDNHLAGSGSFQLSYIMALAL